MLHDVYIVHASENGAGAERLAGALRAKGLRVWFNSFIVGPSIREQMERGLADSHFGVVVLSPEFFTKKWTRQELDALFALEAPGEIRILPVWWGTTEEQVREHSPMLAMRAAAVLTNDDVEAVAEALIRSIVALASYRSRGQRLRLQIVSGLPWHGTPVTMPKSIAEYDRTFEEDFSWTELIYYPSTATRRLGNPVPLVELLRAHSLWDGRRFTAIGHQVPNTVQVFEELIRDKGLPADATRPAGAGIAAYVFQLTSVEFTDQLCYVYCVGPYDRANAGMGPNAPDDESLCWVSGLLMAFGFMKNTLGALVNAIYITASVVMFIPKVDTSSERAP